MADPQNPSNSQNPPPPPSKIPSEIGKGNNSSNSNANADFSGQKVRFPNPPDSTNPDSATLKDQWRFAIRQYSRWYSHAWGTAILAGLSFFALGWIIKGSNPLPSFKNENPSSSTSSSAPNDPNEARR